jgi:hypothetical protein
VVTCSEGKSRVTQGIILVTLERLLEIGQLCHATLYNTYAMPTKKRKTKKWKQG